MVSSTDLKVIAILYSIILNSCAYKYYNSSHFDGRSHILVSSSELKPLDWNHFKVQRKKTIVLNSFLFDDRTMLT